MDQGEALDLEAKARPIGDAAAGQRPITQRQVMLIYFEQRLATAKGQQGTEIHVLLNSICQGNYLTSIAFGFPKLRELDGTFLMDLRGLRQ